MNIEEMKRHKMCSCGSGLSRWPLEDAAGLFCAFVCEKCVDKEKKRWNPKIFTDWYDADQPEPYWPEE